MARRRAATHTIGDQAAVFHTIADGVEQALQGKREAVELAVTCLVAGGHLLIEDVPGVGKTLLAKALAASIDCSWARIQFTPDLLPSDVVGVSVWDAATGAVEFRPGAVFHNLVLGDEINRASPKTQSALLEAMEERQVSLDGHTYLLDEPFMVLATQNPIEFEGTYPLPEGQLDRFMMRISLGYPTRQTEVEILDRHLDDDVADALRPVATGDDVLALRDAAREVHVAPALKGYLADLAAASREHYALAVGMSPRSTLAILRAARVRALSVERDFVVPDDLKALLEPVVAHRLVLAPDARLDGVERADVLEQVSAAVAVPTARRAAT